MNAVALFVHSRCCGEHWVVGQDKHIHCCGCGKSAGSIQVEFKTEPNPISACCGAPFELVVFDTGSFGLACESCQEIQSDLIVTGPEMAAQGCALCAAAARKQKETKPNNN